jgi:hypothetical protein
MSVCIHLYLCVYTDPTASASLYNLFVFFHRVKFGSAGPFKAPSRTRSSSTVGSNSSRSNRIENNVEIMESVGSSNSVSAAPFQIHREVDLDVSNSISNGKSHAATSRDTSTEELTQGYNNSRAVRNSFVIPFSSSPSHANNSVVDANLTSVSSLLPRPSKQRRTHG